jgi:DinB superfamily
MEQNLEQTIALLARTPAALNSFLRGLPDAWTHRNEGGDTWNVFEVVAHLVYGEQADWIPRARIILESGETRTFEPFDRMGHIKLSQGKTLAQLLDEFSRARSESLEQLRALNLRSDDLERRGRHPAFGPVKLSQHLASWVAHDLTHLHQISRIMAHQYREAVGPWGAYLGVLKCAGHSS